MQRVIITTYHDVDDAVADALRDDLTTDTGSADDESTLLEFMRAHPAQTWNATIGPAQDVRSTNRTSTPSSGA